MLGLRALTVLRTSSPTERSNLAKHTKRYHPEHSTSHGKSKRIIHKTSGPISTTICKRSVSDRPKYYKQTSELRSSFLNFFEKNDHVIVPSSNIVPANDPTLLFTSAGMVQFKESFLGLRKPIHTALTTSQKCVRAGGKHNDLDNVGFTARHHTFFEMLGNFSFGAYDKREAIRLAWLYLTKELGLPKERLSISVLNGDVDTANAWKSVAGLTDASIRECGVEDNFWSMGDVGPCGPCTEIFWDQIEPVDGEQYLEIWNLVFMQYLKSNKSTGSQSNLITDISQSMASSLPPGFIEGLSPLPVPCIDTGMGLERLASVVQGKRENYTIDSFDQILSHARNTIEKKIGAKLDDSKKTGAALRVIIDHLRSASFLIAEGLMPGNAGRAYVLRRIIRRATRYEHSLGVTEPILGEIFPAFLQSMQDHYPELYERQDHIKNTLYHEEASFFITIHKGMDEITKLLQHEEANPNRTKVIPGTEVFKLYETYGFPVDLTDLIARENGWAVDFKGFEEVISEQRKKDRQTWKGSGDQQLPKEISQWTSIPKFTGYDHLMETKAEIVEFHHTPSSNEIWISIDPCPFYAESGGQVGDRGIISSSDISFRVVDSVHPYSGGIALKLEIPTPNSDNPDVPQLTPAQINYMLQTGSCVQAVVDTEWRRNVRRNHTATHLLHAALREILGDHVVQAGSRVGSEGLRFDFSHYEPLTAEQISQIELWVNRAISESIKMNTHLMTYDEALAQKATALFSEKYDKSAKLRVVHAPGFSMELCGGTHVSDTSEIGIFKIINQHAVGTGVRRVEALTASSAFDWLSKRSAMVDNIAEILNSRADIQGIPQKIEKLLQSRKDAMKQVDVLKEQMFTASLLSGTGGSSPSTQSESTEESPYSRMTGTYDGKGTMLHHYNSSTDQIDLKYLRSAGDKLRAEFPDQAHILLTSEWLVICATEVPTKDFLRSILTKVGVAGGGPPQMVSGSVLKVGKEQVLKSLKELIAAK